MDSIVGVIRLAPGEVGFYDDLTRIHLTIPNPERPVYSSMNTTNIKRSVRSGRLLLVSGSLEPGAKEEIKKVVEEKKEVKKKAEEPKVKKTEEPKAKEPAAEEAKVEEPKVEEVKAEEPKVEEKKEEDLTKKTSKKTSK